MKKLQSIHKKMNAFVVSVGEKLSWIYLFIVLISIYEVMMRYVFNKPTVWVHETSLSLAAIIMVYGGLYAYAKNKHIAVSVIIDLFPQKVQKTFGMIADFMGLVYLLLLTVSTLMITKLAVFSPNGDIRLERSGSSWNSIFPGIVKICMSLFLILFLLLIITHVVAKCSTLFRNKNKKRSEIV